MIKKLYKNNLFINIKQQCRYIGNREVNLKNPEKEAQLPIFQYPTSKETDRRVYVWGLAETGALGLGLKETSKRNHVINSPSRLSFAERYNVKDIACGFGFTVFNVDSNKVYGCGVNTDSQLGYHEFNQKHLDLILTPLPIEISNSDIIKIAAGRAHLLVLTTNGLFTLGNNSYGQCGRTIIENEKYSGNSIVHHIPQVNGERIRSIHSGQDHSLLITDLGQVYACGWGADGQTGLGHYNNESAFSRLAGDIKGENITKISCNVDCVLAVNDKGELFGWGNSEYGQLITNSDTQQVNTPIRLDHCKNLGKIIDIAAGGSICMALNEEGSVFVWGYGILGKGPEVQHSFNPVRIPDILFGRNDFQPNNRVTSVACGIGHMAAITNFGDLYMWGKNRNGCLGLGHKNDQYFPLKVAVGASVEKVAAGLDHTIALCKAFI